MRFSDTQKKCRFKLANRINVGLRKRIGLLYGLSYDPKWVWYGRSHQWSRRRKIGKKRRVKAPWKSADFFC